MPNKECTVNNTVYELVHQPDAGTCSGCVAYRSEDSIDAPSKLALCYSLGDCVVGFNAPYVWILKEIK